MVDHGFCIVGFLLAGVVSAFSLLSLKGLREFFRGRLLVLRWGQSVVGFDARVRIRLALWVSLDYQSGSSAGRGLRLSLWFLV